jgi:hypothetical protein
VATSLNNLAALLSDTSWLAEAEPLYVRSLGIWEKALGGWITPTWRHAWKTTRSCYETWGAERRADLRANYSRGSRVRLLVGITLEKRRYERIDRWADLRVGAGLSNGLIFGLIVGLNRGGSAVIKHYATTTTVAAVSSTDPHAGSRERGRLKSWSAKFIYVVYRCGQDWDHFDDYTAAPTLATAAVFEAEP